MRLLLRMTSAAALALAASGHAQAQPIATDGSTPTTLSTTGTTTFVDGGAIAGGNQFHSFSEFSVPGGATVDFQNSSAAAIDNVISRVTGSNASGIDGTLRVSVPGANFFLINPNGVVVGDEAVIDVPGATSLVDADRLDFADGAVFSADLASGSTFTVAEPTSFGFLSDPAGGASSEVFLDGATSSTLTIHDDAIRVSDGENVGANQFHSFSRLNVAEGDSLEFVAADTGADAPTRTIASVSSASTFPSLRGTRIDGDVEITNAGPGSEFYLVNPGGVLLADTGSITAPGSLHLSSAETLFLGGAGVFVSVFPENSVLSAGAPEAYDFPGATGRPVLIDGAVELTGDDSVFSVNAYDIGFFGAEISLGASSAAQFQTIAGRNEIGSGFLEIQRDPSNVRVFDTPAGVLELTATQVQAGEIRVSADDVVLRDFSNLLANNAGAAENGALVEITGAQISIDSAGVLATSNGSGPAIVDLRADRLGVSGGLIGAQALNQGLGEVLLSIVAKEDVAISEGSRLVAANDGEEGAVVSIAGALVDGVGAERGDLRVAITDAVIETTPFADVASSGVIVILADELQSERSRISSNVVDGQNRGRVAEVVLDVVDLELSATEISTSTTGVGAAPNISIGAGETATIANGSTITSTSSGAGASGSITIGANSSSGSDSASDGLSLTFDDASIIASAGPASANAGDIDIDAETLIVRNSEIRADNFQRSPDASEFLGVTVVTEDLQVENSAITTRTRGPANSGAITILSTNSLVLKDGSVLSTSSLGSGSAGPIFIIADFDAFLTVALFAAAGLDAPPEVFDALGGSLAITLDDAQIASSAATIDGAPGAVFIFADVINATNSEISTSNIEGAIAVGLGPTLGANTRLELDDTTVLATTSGAGDALTFNVRSNGALRVVNGSRILATSTGTGAAGGVLMTADEMVIEDALLSSSADVSGGSAGFVNLTGRDLRVLDSEIATTTVSGGEIEQSNVFFDFERIDLAGSRIASDTSGAADAGSIRLFASDEIAIRDGSRITSTSTGEGDGGTILIFGGIENDFPAPGDLNLSVDGSTISTTATATGVPGSMIVSAETLDVNESTISGETVDGSAGQGFVTVFVEAESLRITDSEVSTTTTGRGNAGTLELAANDLLLIDQSRLLSSTSAQGDAARIFISDRNRTDFDPGPLRIEILDSRIETSTRSEGDAANIEIFGATTTISDSIITTSSSSDGAAARVALLTTDRLRVENSELAARMSGRGGGGNVVIIGAVDPAAPRTFSPGALDATFENSTFASTTTGEGNSFGGEVYANRVVSRGSQIASASSGAGDGGNLILIVFDEIDLEDSEILASTAGSGEAGVVQIAGEITTDGVLPGALVLSLDQSRISSETEGAGDANQVLLTVDELSLASSDISTATSGDGDASQVVINAGSVALRDGGRIVSTTSGTGDGGDVLLRVGDLTLSGADLNGGPSRVAASALDAGSGAPGEVFIDADGAVRITDRARIETDSASNAPSGRIDLEARQVDIAGGALSSVASGADNDAGSIELLTDAFALRSGGAITTNSNDGAAGGITVTVAPDQTVFLDRGVITTTSEGGDQSGGDIAIRSADGAARPIRAVVLRGSTLEALGGGQGASLIVESETLIVDIGSIIAIDGTLDIPETDESLTSTPLDIEFLNTSEVLRDQCAGQRGGDASVLALRSDLGLRTRPGLGAASVEDAPTSPLYYAPTRGSAPAVGEEIALASCFTKPF